ncbi:uncharacterized protein LDX57_012243 [Aspergillus melleus]|uniref:uncharacterized protein n=1 Tax=Aspergillus melleus TaxID=138277 RepID=UPI001E8E96F0|nr:uncharacterized protein LDX57_012243 [Aspergillus melleus]KAH8434601.1 hypothetical protein LDX57_012243 [Aspergillus melleus]
MAQQGGGGGGGDAPADPERARQSRVSVSEGRSSRRVSRVSYKEDYANLDEYGKLVKYVSTYREGQGGSGSEEEEVKRVWYAPWKKRKVHVKNVDQDAQQLPPEWLLTDIRQGLPSGEVPVRRRRSGWNELVSEKENPIAKILSYFRGPILYGKSGPCLCK